MCNLLQTVPSDLETIRREYKKVYNELTEEDLDKSKIYEIMKKNNGFETFEAMLEPLEWLGVSESTLKDFKNNKNVNHTKDTLKAICKAYNCNLELCVKIYASSEHDLSLPIKENKKMLKDIYIIGISNAEKNIKK